MREGLAHTGYMATSPTCRQTTEIRWSPFRETLCGNSMPCTLHADDNQADAMSDAEWFATQATRRPTSSREIR